MFNGKFRDIGPVLVRDKLWHTPKLLSSSIVSGGNTLPIMIVMKQFTNNMPKKMIPFISELNMDEIAKNETKIKGAKRNPTYNNECKFNTSTMFDCMYVYIHTIRYSTFDRFYFGRQLWSTTLVDLYRIVFVNKMSNSIFDTIH
jgi:hypothetical protein